MLLVWSALHEECLGSFVDSDVAPRWWVLVSPNLQERGQRVGLRSIRTLRRSQELLPKKLPRSTGRSSSCVFRVGTTDTAREVDRDALSTTLAGTARAGRRQLSTKGTRSPI
jgi:hypothetical protein